MSIATSNPNRRWLGVTGRVLAALAGPVLIGAAGYGWFVGTIFSQEGWDDYNGLQLAVVNLVAAALIGTGAVACTYASTGRHWRKLIVGLLCSALLVGLSLLGFQTWCSDCGIP